MCLHILMLHVRFQNLPKFTPGRALRRSHSPKFYTSPYLGALRHIHCTSTSHDSRVVSEGLMKKSTMNPAIARLGVLAITKPRSPTRQPTISQCIVCSPGQRGAEEEGRLVPAMDQRENERSTAQATERRSDRANEQPIAQSSQERILNDIWVS